jgi:hypothetical protein
VIVTLRKAAITCGAAKVADAGAIFPKGHVADRVQIILTAPMSANQCEQAEGAGLGWRETGNEIDHLLPGVALGCAETRELPNLGQSGPGGCEIASELATHAEAAQFGPSPLPIPGCCLEAAGIRIGKIRDQIGEQAGLIVFDEENGIGLLFLEQAHELPLGMERICGTNAPAQWQSRKPGLSHWNLIGLLLDSHLEQGCMAVMRTEGEQVWSRGGVGSRATQRLAIQGQGVIRLCYQGRLYPGRPYALKGEGIELGE